MSANDNIKKQTYFLKKILNQGQVGCFDAMPGCVAITDFYVAHIFKKEEVALDLSKINTVMDIISFDTNGASQLLETEEVRKTPGGRLLIKYKCDKFHAWIDMSLLRQFPVKSEFWGTGSTKPIIVTEEFIPIGAVSPCRLKESTES